MANFDKLQSLWKESSYIKKLPSSIEVQLLANRYQKRVLVKNILTIISLLLTIAVFVYGWTVFNLEPISKAGLLTMSLAIGFYIALLTKQISFIVGKIDDTLQNREYLRQLIKLKKQQQFVQHTGFITYGILLSIGMALYLFQFASRDLIFGITIYGITFSFILFCLIYIQKKSIPRDSAKLNTFIAEVEKLLKEME